MSTPGQRGPRIRRREASSEPVVLIDEPSDSMVQLEAPELTHEPRVTVACDWCGMLCLSGPSCEWCGTPFRGEDLERMARNASEVSAAIEAMGRRLEEQLREAERARQDMIAEEEMRSKTETRARHELEEELGGLGWADTADSLPIPSVPRLGRQTHSSP
jgi:hypothetical protein